MTVRIYHPNLPGQYADVPESSVPHHARAGWVTERPEHHPDPEPPESPPDEASDQTEAPADAGASASQRRRRRAQTEESED